MSSRSSRSERPPEAGPTASAPPLLVSLGVALCLRVALVLLGGQMYFPDEIRYMRSVRLFDTVFVHGTVVQAMDALLASPPHMGFALLGMLAEGPRNGIAGLLGLPVSAAPTPALLWIPALLFSLTSVGSIALTYGLARRTGGSRDEARFAAMLMSCATSMLFYARHLVPYDTALCLALLGLWTGAAPRWAAWRSFLVGLCGGFAFLTYNGYWLIAAVIVALHAVQPPWSPREIARRGAWAAFGLASVPQLVVVLSVYRGIPLVGALRAFAAAVSQGDYSEGWSFPWEYLWHAEHALLLVWILGAGLVVWGVLRGRPAARSRGLFWLGGAALVYLLLVLGSAVLQRFVVYGRLVRQMVPFLCVATAVGLSGLSARLALSLRLRRFAVAAVAACGVVNMVPLFGQWFPADIERRAAAAYGPVARDWTIAGCCETFDSDALSRGDAAPPSEPRYVLVNAGYLYPIEGVKQPPPGKVVFRVPHPLQFRPYRYESYGARARAVLGEADLSMMVIERGE